MAAPVFNTDMRGVGEKLRDIRTQVVDLIIPVQNINEYADVELSTTWSALLRILDDTCQATKETEIELQNIIVQYLMVHSEINNKDLIADIIAEFSIQSQKLQDNAKQAGQIANVEALKEGLMGVKSQFDSVVKDGNEKIDATLEEATAHVANLKEKASKIEKKLFEVQRSHNLSSVGHQDRTGLFTSRWTKLPRIRHNEKHEEPETGNMEHIESDHISPPTSKEELEAELTDARKELKDALEAEINAKRKIVARNSIRITETQAKFGKLDNDLSGLLDEEQKLLNAWNAMAKEVAEYLSLLEKSRDDDTKEAQHSLYKHIHKVSSTKEKLMQFAESLKHSAYDL
ncbi:uncharacterized protein LAESUDRAFT_731697 [Laetiporus sulphureus 93-53]|uniref:ELM2 domain-containing protein n=1 Tax=Laetiporus sulphureus 93-53 TaxID=1314785 RepID=A0A165BFX5_9APHY|nr:uncharacterized protein LAESUDRAFT_731697 [Laetiporus sulphureus 93-53]KZT00974.1 hypothetical protein LAESUDRAFT_731697 [Laetiporus sulphureus 93-53]